MRDAEGFSHLNEVTLRDSGDVGYGMCCMNSYRPPLVQFIHKLCLIRTPNARGRGCGFRVVSRVVKSNQSFQKVISVIVSQADVQRP